MPILVHHSIGPVSCTDVPSESTATVTGMEAIYEFDLQDMPVTVAVDSEGTSVHTTGPIEWCQKIGKIPVNTLFGNKH